MNRTARRPQLAPSTIEDLLATKRWVYYCDETEPPLDDPHDFFDLNGGGKPYPQRSIIPFIKELVALKNEIECRCHAENKSGIVSEEAKTA